MSEPATRPAHWHPRDLRRGDVVKTPAGLGLVVEGAPGILNPALAMPLMVRLYGEEAARLFPAGECVLLCGRCMCCWHGGGLCPVTPVGEGK